MRRFCVAVLSELTNLFCGENTVLRASAAFSCSGMSACLLRMENVAIY